MKADRLHKFNSLALPKFVKYKNKVTKNSKKNTSSFKHAA